MDVNTRVLLGLSLELWRRAAWADVLRLLSAFRVPVRTRLGKSGEGRRWERGLFAQWISTPRGFRGFCQLWMSRLFNELLPSCSLATHSPSSLTSAWSFL